MPVIAMSLDHIMMHVHIMIHVIVMMPGVSHESFCYDALLLF